MTNLPSKPAPAPSGSRDISANASETAPRSIVVIAKEHIGDLVCTTPALRSLRRLYPNAHITVDVGERAACVLANCPYVDEVVGRPAHQGIVGKAKYVAWLRKRKFDLGVVLYDSPDLRLFLRLSGTPRRIGIVRKPRFANCLTDIVAWNPTGHETNDNYRSVIAHLGGDVSDPRPEVFPTNADEQAVQQILKAEGVAPNTTLIALNPSTSMAGKFWPAERFAELGNLLNSLPNTRLLLLGGPGDEILADEICAGMTVQPVVLTGKLTILQLAALLKHCRVLVTGDTGPMHISCAVGTPVVALFGPTNPIQTGPGYAPGNTIIRKVSACPECTLYVCRHNSACLRQITAQEVAQAVHNHLRVSPPAPPSHTSPLVLNLTSG